MTFSATVRRTGCSCSARNGGHGGRSALAAAIRVALQVAWLVHYAVTNYWVWYEF
jgi:hypothetical protein